MKIWKNYSREVERWKNFFSITNMSWELNDILNLDKFVPQKRGKIGLN